MNHLTLFLAFPLFALCQTPDLTSLQISNGVIRISWAQGEPPYAVDGRSDLVSGSWEPLLTTSNLHAVVNSGGTSSAIRVRSLFAQTARYELTFTSAWSAVTHPVNFPSFPHWSGLVGATHRSDLSLWSPGGLASPGVRQVAETGGKLGLLGEVNTALAAGQVEHVLSGPGIFASPGAISYSFDVSQSHPLVSLVSMLAPSPDWFSGVHDLPLFDPAQGWLEPSVTLFLYDAGTDGGPSYSSANDPLPTANAIELLDDVHTRVGGALRPVATFHFRRM